MTRIPPDAYRGRRVFLTGHTGFKGSWLALWLWRLGAEVCGYALPPEQAEGVYVKAGVSGLLAKEWLADIRDHKTLAGAMEECQPEFVFHLAAQPIVRISYANPKETFDVNAGGTVNILECVRGLASVRGVVCVTSDKCYRNKEWIWGYRENDELGGSDPYSASKACAELIFQSYAASFFSGPSTPGVASARAGNVIGGGDWSPSRIVPDCIRSLRDRQPLTLRNPQSTRPWQHVLEPLSGYMRLMLALEEDARRFSGSWNFGPDAHAGYSVAMLASRIIEHWGEGEMRIAPEINAPHEAGLLHLNIDKARFELGWRPRWDFAATAAHTVEWYKRVHGGEPARDVTMEQITRYEEAAESRI